MKKNVLLFLVTLILSCENTEIIIDSDNLLIGHWAEPIYKGETTTFKRVSSKPKENFGITFYKNNEYIERTSGWCGTPPLTFFNEEGTYQLKNTLIKISKNSFPNNFSWRIISISETELVVKRELTEQEIEHQKLMNLFNEIQVLAYSKTCVNLLDWSFVAYGSKACGGPRGYIPYSKNIDTVSFLQKIKKYSEYEKEFNIKWGVISDCAILNPPKNIECKNSYPVLKY